MPDDIKDSHQKNITKFDALHQQSRPMGFQGNIHGKTKNGDLIPLDISIQKHSDSDDFKYTAMCRDISEIVKTKDALIRNKDRLINAQKLTNIGNWEWEIETGKLYWSRQIFTIFGLDYNKFEPSYDAFLNTIHPLDRNKVSKAVEKCVSEKAPYKINHRIICPDGTEKMVQEIGDVFCNAEGTPIRMDGTVQDITERWHKEQELLEAKKSAEEAVHSKNQFLATMSHELRTPLNAIIGFSTLITEKTFGHCDIPQHTEYSQAILDSGNHLLSIISNILDLTKIDLDKLDLKPRIFKAENLVQECLYVTNHLALKKDIFLKVNIQDNFPELYLDRTYCLQILVNLITNAIKFSPNDTSVNLDLDFEGDQWSLTVKDEGIGISKEVQKTIWEPFTQVDMNIARQYDGSGLGLSIIKGLSEAQQGHVTLESEQGKGSTFKVTLPLSIE